MVGGAGLGDLSVAPSAPVLKALNPKCQTLNRYILNPKS